MLLRRFGLCNVHLCTQSVQSSYFVLLELFPRVIPVSIGEFNIGLSSDIQPPCRLIPQSAMFTCSIPPATMTHELSAVHRLNPILGGPTVTEAFDKVNSRVF